jgi:hypothetical protein
LGFFLSADRTAAHSVPQPDRLPAQTACRPGSTARTRSESDGFVLIEQVRPGDYRLEIAPDQARNLKIRLVSEQHIHVGTKGKLIRLKIVVAPN